MSVHRQDLPDIFTASVELTCLRQGAGVGEEDWQNQEVELMITVEQCLHRHHVPAVVIGSGRGNLSAKYHAFMHGLYLR